MKSDGEYVLLLHYSRNMKNSGCFFPTKLKNVQNEHLSTIWVKMLAIYMEMYYRYGFGVRDDPLSDYSPSMSRNGLFWQELRKGQKLSQVPN